MDKTQEENHIALFGGREIELSIGGNVKVRALPVREFPRLAASLDDEPALVELFTGLTAKEVDSLPIRDFEEILEEGRRINYPPFSRWTHRQTATAEFIASITADPTDAATSGASGASA